MYECMHAVVPTPSNPVVNAGEKEDVICMGMPEFGVSGFNAFHTVLCCSVILLLFLRFYFWIGVVDCDRSLHPFFRVPASP